MSDYSYATRRKIKRIEEHYGPDWKARIGDRSIDAVYNDLVGDTRRNVFAKIPVEVKDHLDEMVKANRVQMAEFLTTVIEEKYAQFRSRQELIERSLRDEFTGA